MEDSIATLRHEARVSRRRVTRYVKEERNLLAGSGDGIDPPTFFTVNLHNFPHFEKPQRMIPGDEHNMPPTSKSRLGRISPHLQPMERGDPV